jgi:hypothetical protein
LIRTSAETCIADTAGQSAFLGYRPLGKVVGRIYEDASASAPPDMRWFWSITEIVPAVSGGLGESEFYHAAARA